MPERLGEDREAYGELPGALGVFLTGVKGDAHRPLAYLLWSGVFERHPGLRFVLTEQMAYWVPYTLAYLDDLYTRPIFAQLRERLPLPPSEYWRRQCWVGASFLTKREVMLRDGIGVGSIMWGSDFPHAEGTWPYTREKLREAFNGVPVDEVVRMLGRTAAKVYGFDLEKLAPLADRVGPRADDLFVAASWAILQSVLIPLVARAQSLPQTTIEIVADIDGRSQLILRGNTAQWHHLEYAAPGRENFDDYPTTLNGVDWYPAWPDDPDAENRVDCFSDVFAGVTPPLPAQPTEVGLQIVKVVREDYPGEGGGPVTIVQFPAPENDFTVIVEFDDNEPSGSAFYDVRLRIRTLTMTIPVDIKPGRRTCRLPATRFGVTTSTRTAAWSSTVTSGRTAGSRDSRRRLRRRR